MKDFNFKEKEVAKDEDILKYKNFNKVLEKHKTITKSYNTIKKIWGGIILVSLFGVISFYNFKNKTPLSKTNNITEQKASTSIKPIFIKAVEKSSETEISPVIKAVIIKEKKLITEVEKTNIQEEKEFITKDQPEENIKEVVPGKSNKKDETLDDYYQLQQKTEQERIKLPTLFIAGKAWPAIVRKRDFIKQPNITAAYTELNKEIPIISYSISRVNPEDYKKENNKIFNNDGRQHTASILREIHRSKSGEFIIYKNIIVFIPGMGRVNLGDLKVEIANNQTYYKRLRALKSSN